MKFTERHVADVVIVGLDGKLTLGTGDTQLRQIIRDLLDRDEKHLVLDFSGVTYMDSAGVGELVASFTAAESRDAELKLLDLPEKIRDLLRFTQLITVFESYDTESAAVASFE